MSPQHDELHPGRFFALARHAVWLVSLFVVLAGWVQVRHEVQQLRKDLDRSGRARHEAQILNDRLQLEVDARRRTAAMEQIAAQLHLSDQTTTLHLDPRADLP